MNYKYIYAVMSVAIAASATATVLTASHQGEPSTKANPSTFKTAVKMADAAYHAVINQPAFRYRYFKTNSEEDIDMLRNVFSKIENACDITQTNVVFRCDPPGGECVTSAAHVPVFPRDDSNNKIYICPNFFDKWGLNDGDRARILVHESSHVPYIRGTADYNKYGLWESLQLPRDVSLWHADSYAWFAVAARNGDFD
ncbi:uncharacterized protein PgNI_07830 [Pyricularia grisea]|uniref:Lysine-specific metallo-endopeptidase domain-containing protein n=1 Tax=Pyricularia grisea TaxID=148305 RepID=A0A6P8B2Z8_PYRGI|nr:uncharacterized protein PgNI_07830 [Pyricularia grisea]TLD09179.1 hypothetical protein PgNI_07830 [Pyricularia grisea]